MAAAPVLPGRLPLQSICSQPQVPSRSGNDEMGRKSSGDNVVPSELLTGGSTGSLQSITANPLQSGDAKPTDPRSE